MAWTAIRQYRALQLRSHRAAPPAGRGRARRAAATLDYSKLGAGDAATDDGWFSFANGHSVLFSEMPNPPYAPATPA